MASGSITKTAAQDVLKLAYSNAEDIVRTKRRGTLRRDAKWLIAKTLRRATPGIYTKLFRIDKESGREIMFAKTRVLTKELQAQDQCKRVTGIPLRSIVEKVYSKHNVDLENPPDEWRKVEVGSDGYTPSRKGSWGSHLVSIRFLQCGEPMTWFIHQFIPSKGGRVSAQSIFGPVVEELLEMEGSLELVRIVGDGKERKLQKGMQSTGATMGCEVCPIRGESLPGGGKGKRISFPMRLQTAERRNAEKVRCALLDGDMDEDGVLQKPTDGISCWSPLLNLPNFDVILQGPLDAMHLLAYGLSQKLFLLCFMALTLIGAKNKGRGKGKSNRKKLAARRKDRKRIQTLGKVLSKIKVPCEIQRRPREVDVAKWKTSEWMFMGMYVFVYIAHSALLKGRGRKRKILLLFCYIYRAVYAGDDEWALLGEVNVERAVKRLQRLCEKEFGEGVATFNDHCVFAHLVETRSKHGAMHRYSTWRYEDAIHKVLRSYKKGTPHEGLQAMENRYYTFQQNHICPSKKRLKITTRGRASKTDDSLLWTEKGFFRVEGILPPGDRFRCRPIETRPFSTADQNLQELRWKMVGVSRLAKRWGRRPAIQKEGELVTIARDDIKGKAVIIEDLIISMPREWLLE